MIQLRCIRRLHVLVQVFHAAVLSTLLALLLGSSSAFADPEPPAPPAALDGFRRFSFNSPTSKVALKGYLELGMLAVVEHTIQKSSDGTLFDYKSEGGQDSAFFFARISAELEILKRHTLILLYQPIDLRTQSTLLRTVRVDGLDFPAGTPMQYRYGFDFYRLSYLYDFIANPRHELSLGLSLQLRVANIEFASLDGRLQRTSQNLGPVPIIKLRGRYTFDNSAFLGFELDGIGIQFPSDLGSVLGLLFDASLRVGFSPTNFLETFINLRYLGGGARGPGQTPQFGDGYVDNFIHTLILSIGFGVK